jgi:hypothetical protein
MKHAKAFMIVMCTLTILSCRLTSPTPAAWSGTPTAQAQGQTETAIAQTAVALFNDQPTDIPLPELPTEQNHTSTPPPPMPVDGPWLIYPGAEGLTLQAYDMEAQVILDIPLPPPIIFTDLIPGRSPQGGRLVIRAGSPENLDELALYQVDLLTAEVTKISPLLSLALQRQIVNEEGDRALEALKAVTKEHGVSWSPDGRYLAFTAALNNSSSDLYLYDTWQQETTRLNGLYTHNGTPYWSPGGNWLISQEFDLLSEDQSWDAVNVTALQVPGYDDQNSLYLPPAASQSEIFIGWVNAQSFLSFSQTPNGPQMLRDVNVETGETNIIFADSFMGVAYDPESKFLAFILDQSTAVVQDQTAGIYGLQASSPNLQLIRAGIFNHLAWNTGGMFIASGPGGVFGLSAAGTDLFLPAEENASLAPNGTWLIAWGAGPDNTDGARLYQTPINQPLQTLLSTSVETVVWQPDSRGLLILSEGTLYHLTFPGLKPQVVTGRFSEGTPQVFAWVE